MTLVRDWRWLCGLAALFALGGCATIHRNEARYERDMLVPAGFDVEPADSPERVQELQALPPLRMVTEGTDGGVVYRLADPYLCRCLYEGNSTTYREYRRLVSEDFLNTLVDIHLQ